MSKLLSGGALYRILIPGCFSGPRSKRITHSKENHPKVPRARPQRSEFILQNLIPMDFCLCQRAISSGLPQATLASLVGIPPPYCTLYPAPHPCAAQQHPDQGWARPCVGTVLPTRWAARPLLPLLHSAFVAQMQPQMVHTQMGMAVFQ